MIRLPTAAPFRLDLTAGRCDDEKKFEKLQTKGVI
jgi:hypothetical protein